MFGPFDFNRNGKIDAFDLMILDTMVREADEEEFDEWDRDDDYDDDEDEEDDEYNEDYDDEEDDDW